MKIASWRTTALGALSIFTVVAQAVGTPLLDGDPETGPDIQAVFDAVLTYLPVIFTGLGLMVARDNVVSWQDVGIRKEADAALRRTGVR